MARPRADRSGRSARRHGRTLTLRGDGDRADDGATVVRAVVHARLLGLRLLTLDARVVVAPAEVEPTSLDLMTPMAVEGETAPTDQAVGTAIPAGPALAGRPLPPSVDGGVSRARELLAEGTHTLARAARSV
ncbi:MAG: hypothetical protein ACXV4A_00540 [Actinomycetes bacterium]